MARKSKPGRPMREVAYHHIQKRISARELRAGAPVSDLAIAKELGISRTPAREAIRQLVSEGLLDSVPGRGVVVVTLDRSDLQDLYEMREALEVRAARVVAGRGAGDSDLAGLRTIAGMPLDLIHELQASGKPVLDAAQMARFEAADLAFHTYLMRLAGNRRSLKAVASIRLLIRIFAARHRGHGLAALQRIHQDHVDVVDAIEAGNPDAAAEALSRHVSGSWRERIAEFDRREREAALPHDLDSFMDEIRHELA